MNPDESMFRRDQAQDLYLYSGKTQKEIAAEVGISDRTLYEWIKRFNWNAQKQRIEKPPLTLTEGIVLELTNLQTQILAKDTGVPSIDQANIMHKLVWCLFKLNAIPSVSTEQLACPPSKGDDMTTSCQGDVTNTPIIPPEADPLASSPSPWEKGSDRRSGDEATNQITPSPCLPAVAGEREPEGKAPTSASDFFPKPEDILPPLTDNQSTTPLLPPSGSDTEPELSRNESSCDLMSIPLKELSNGANNKEHANEKTSNDSSNKEAEPEANGSEADIPTNCVGTDNSLTCPPLAGVDRRSGGGTDSVTMGQSTENNPNSQSEESSLSAPRSPLSEDPPLTYREKIWELMKKEAKKNGLWQPRGLPSDLLEPGTPEWEEREKKRRAAIDRMKEEMKREQYTYKRRNDY